MSNRMVKRLSLISVVLVVALVIVVASGCFAADNQVVENEDATVVNNPRLTKNMIPVYYDEVDKCWKKADSSNSELAKWYDYGEKQWANAVTVSTSEYDDAKCGTKIDEEDVLGYWVWIPRYAYKLNEENGIFDIVFLRGTSSEVDDTVIGSGAYSDYKVHPVFTADASNGGWTKELTGFWVAKFEASCSETNQIEDTTGRYVTKVSGDSTPVQVVGKGTVSDNCDIYGRGDGFAVFKPNVTSWRGINVIDIYKASKEVAKAHGVNADSHMMKNSEWGAVAYLSKSKYGNLNIWTNPYNEGELHTTGKEYTFYSYTAATITGMSGDVENAKSVYRSEKLLKKFSEDSISITYKELDKDFNILDEYANSYFRYNSENGVKASTTGNVYGIYDMSGGAWEYVAAYVENESNKYITSYFSTLKPQYVNCYSMSKIDNGLIYSNKGNPKHTIEEMQAANLKANSSKYGDAVIETSGFDGDHASYPGGAMSFFMRGCSAGYGEEAGIFAFGCDDGGEFNTYGFRVVLTR